MAVRAANPDLAKLYDHDFLRWTEEIVRVLRAGQLEELDVEHLTEEIEDIGTSQRREVRSRLRVVLVHLLKWGWQPNNRSNSWRSTAAAQRADLDDLFSDSPSLRATLLETIAVAYFGAVKEASLESGLPADTFPEHCPFTPDQILDQEYFPS